MTLHFGIKSAGYKFVLETSKQPKPGHPSIATCWARELSDNVWIVDRIHTTNAVEALEDLCVASAIMFLVENQVYKINIRHIKPGPVTGELLRFGHATKDKNVIKFDKYTTHDVEDVIAQRIRDKKDKVGTKMSKAPYKLDGSSMTWTYGSSSDTTTVDLYETIRTTRDTIIGATDTTNRVEADADDGGGA